MGILKNTEKSTQKTNIGKSDYSKHLIQPWNLWIEYNLNPFDADIVKRVLRTKEGESRILDYKKIIHVCEERIRQEEGKINSMNDDKHEKSDIIIPNDPEVIRNILKTSNCPQWRDFLEQKLNDLENE